MSTESENASERWNMLGNRLPKSEIVYFCQMIVVYVIIITFSAEWKERTMDYVTE